MGLVGVPPAEWKLLSMVGHSVSQNAAVEEPESYILEAVIEPSIKHSIKLVLIWILFI